jgi:hypothetical protein
MARVDGGVEVVKRRGFSFLFLTRELSHGLACFTFSRERERWMAMAIGSGDFTRATGLRDLGVLMSSTYRVRWVGGWGWSSN